MSLARAMRRKAEREKTKSQRPKGAVTDWNGIQMSGYTGVKVQTLCDWLDARAAEMQNEMAENMARLLWESEDYMATANVIIALHAVLRTFGDLKTVQKGMGRLVRNFDGALEQGDQVGIKEAYRELEEAGIAFAFDDFDINTLFDDPGKSRVTVARMKNKYFHMAGKKGAEEQS